MTRRSANATDAPDLLPSVATGDESAVRACLDRYGGLVWSLARRMCPTESEAEDAVQDIFVDVWKSAGRFDPTMGSEVTFVATIARRRLIDRRRRAGRRPVSVTLDESYAMPSSGGEDGDAGAARVSLSERSEQVLALFEQLSEAQQRVLRLSLVSGLSHEGIAQAIDMPLGTVKTHARRGLIKLRDLLRAKGAFDEADEQAGSDAVGVTR
ncbi:MAG: sigma-70 family RNA polymerase sigma factor [Phycisphaerales bacterium]